MLLYMPVKERLKEFIKYKDLSIRQFTKEIGVSESYVSNMRASIHPEKIKSIANKYPELNTEWLLTGEGSMLKEDLNQNYQKNIVEVSAEAWDIIKKQAESLASKDRQVEELISLLKKANVHQEENAVYAAASGSYLEK